MLLLVLGRSQSTYQHTQNNPHDYDGDNDSSLAIGVFSTDGVVASVALLELAYFGILERYVGLVIDIVERETFRIT